MFIGEGRGIGGAALVAFALVLLAGAARAELNPAQKALAEQGRYWEDRHRPDRAIVAWQKLLESDPDNAEALLHLGILEARTGHLDQARSYAARLKAAHPEARENEILDHAIAQGAINPNTIEEARRLARSGQYDAAIAIYRRALNNQPPPPDLAQEYYETLAGTKSGWDEARRALQDLAEALPDDASIQYAYARVLTYHEETRREGIQRLAALANSSTIGRQATQAWHDALVWLGATRNDIPLYTAYLSAHADDTTVAQKLEAVQNPAANAQYAADEAHRHAFDELSAGHLREAERLFEGLLRSNENDSNALGGLGVVREREGRLREAHELLSRAVALQKGQSQWNGALQSVVYLETVAEAKAALRAHNLRVAEAKAREAMEHLLAGNVDAELVLAQVYRETKRWREAEEIYRHVLRVSARNREAEAGLAAVLMATGRAQEARRFAAEVPGGIQNIQQAEADRLASQARAQINAGDVNGAIASFRDAISRAPANPWLRLDYARLIERVGDRAGADREILDMVNGPNPSGDTFAAAAIWYGEHGQYDNAARYAARVPPAQRNAQFTSLEQQWHASYDAQHAVELARQGRIGEAHRILEGIVAGARGNIGIVGVAAEAYIDINEPKAAIDAMRGVATNSPSLDVQIQYAGILLRVGSLDEASAVMNGIDRQSANLSPAQQARVADLHRGLAIKLADEARLRGDYAGAYDRLAPELAISRDPTVLAALARIYQSAGRPDDATDIYERILRAEPTNMDARREIIGAAIAVGDYGRAQELLSQALAQEPEDARLHLLAAELARAQGDNDAALAELARAQAELTRRNVGWLIPSPYEPGPSYGGYYNPFRANYPPQPAAAPAPAPYYTTNYTVYQTPTTYGTNPAYPVPQITTPIATPAPATEDQLLAQQVATETEQIRDAQRPFVEGGIGFRNIEGEPALYHLSFVDIPVTGGGSVGPGMLTLSVEGVIADSGTLDNTDPGVFRKFGTDTVLPRNVTTAPPYSGSARGVAVAVGYDMPNLSAALGTTPEGFPTSNMIGHLVWAIPFDSQTSLKLSGFRDPVTESLLSYAGIRDPNSGITWGGVVKTGGRVDIGHDNGVVGYYGDATFAYLDGTHVASNYMFDGGGGAYWRIYRTAGGALKIGVNLSAQSYQKNLDYFTLGQGGYFSPQAAVEATIPIEYSGKWGRLSYDVGGQLGIMNFHENSSPYFPLDPNLQALALATNGGVNVYPSQTVTTALYGVSAKVEYEVAPLLVVGARAEADNSFNYNEQSLLLYIRKKFDTN